MERVSRYHCFRKRSPGLRAKGIRGWFPLDGCRMFASGSSGFSSEVIALPVTQKETKYSFGTIDFDSSILSKKSIFILLEGTQTIGKERLKISLCH